MARILLVDDDPDQLELLALVLGEQGHAVATARNGQEALEHLRSAPADLALLDLTMPGFDGAHFVEALRRSGLPQLPILVASARPDVAERSRRLGAAGFLSKPYDFDTLSRALERVLSAPRRP